MARYNLCQLIQYPYGNQNFTEKAEGRFALKIVEEVPRFNRRIAFHVI